MSYVADVILTTGLVDQNIDLGGINAWLDTECGATLSRIDTLKQGAYAMQRTVWIGGFNYLRADQFLERVRALPWKDRDSVQVLICEEHECQFTDRWR